jgi:hypothetical protein
MFKKIIPLIILFFLASCYREAPDKQVNFDMSKVIPQEKMVEVMTDMHLLEGAVLQKQRQNAVSYKASPYYNIILEKHQITGEQFEESVRYYTYHTGMMDKIFEEVIVNLSKKESELMNPAQ